MHYWCIIDPKETSRSSQRKQPQNKSTKRATVDGRLVLTANPMEIMTNIFIHIAFFTISSWVHLHNNARNMTENVVTDPFEIEPQENTWIFFNFGYWTYSGLLVSCVLCDSTVLCTPQCSSWRGRSGPFTCLTPGPTHLPSGSHHFVFQI